MSMTLAQLWQIVADAKNDLHVVEQELAKRIDEEEKRQDKLPVYENFLPVGTYLLSEEEHRKAPIGTLNREYDYNTDEIGTWSWRKVGPDEWAEYDPYGPTHLALDTADVTQVWSSMVNVVVDS